MCGNSGWLAWSEVLCEGVLFPGHGLGPRARGPQDLEPGAWQGLLPEAGVDVVFSPPTPRKLQILD